MLSSTLLLLLAVLTSISSAQIFARHVPVEARNVSLTGGFALVPEKFCPNDLVFCGSSSSACCPTSLTCSASAGDFDDYVCCSGEDSCGTAFDAAPYCADDSWSLWDSSQGGINSHGYFCCASGLVGLLSGACVDPATLSSPTVEALALNPGGGVISTTTEAETTGTAVVTVTGSGATTILTTTMKASSVVETVTAATSAASGNASSKASSSSSSSTTVATATSVIGSSAAGAVTTSASSSASASATKASSSAGNSGKTFGFGSALLAQSALVLFVYIML